MTISARAYVDADLPTLQAALSGWIREAGWCGYCHVGEIPHRIYENMRGRRPVSELVRVWEDGAEIVAFAICARFDAAFVVFASPRLRGTAAELEMFESAYETTRRHVLEVGRGGTEVLYDLFSDDDTGIAQIRTLGFEEYRVWTWVNERALTDAVPEPRLPDGFTIRSATIDDAAQLAAARNGSFDTDWTPESYRDEVMRKPGYDAEREVVVVAPDGRIAAYTIVWLDERNRAGQFEPVGTHRDWQRRGLARAMLLHCLRDMQRRGIDLARVECDATNEAAIALYRSVGFEKQYETRGYRRSIEAP